MCFRISALQIYSVVVLFSLVASTVKAYNEGPISRIIGGMPININRASYMVQIKKRNGDLHCGGTLVSPKHVVTAGHCFNEYYGLMTVVGGVSTLTQDGVKRSIEDVFIHPDYNAADMHSDAAIALLDRPMVGANIRPIKLCDHPLNPGDTLQVSGWGRQTKNGKVSPQLQTVQLSVTTKETCAGEYKKFVVKNMFCASGLKAEGIWKGDSGGPAVNGGQLCGICAFADESGDLGHPSVFTDVYALRSYIEHSIESSN